MKKLFLINLLILSIFFGFVQKASAAPPRVFDVEVTQIGAAVPNMVKEGQFNLEVTFVTDKNDSPLDLSVVPNVTFTPSGGSPISIDPTNPTDPANFGPTTGPSADHNYWIFKGTGLVSRGMGQGIATVKVSGAKNTAGEVMSPDSSHTFIIDTIPPEVAGDCIGGIKVMPDPARAGEVTIKIEFIEEPPAPGIPDMLDYTVSPRVIFYPKDQTTSISVIQVSYASNVWTGTALIDPATPNGKATIVVTGASDKAGNQMTACNVVTFLIDTTAPASWAKALPAYSNGSQISVNYEANDPGASNSGIATVALWYRLAGAADWIYSGLSSSASSGVFNFNVSSLPGGTYEFATMATDKAANQEALPTVADASTILDSKPPMVVLARADRDPANEGFVNITVTFSDDASGLNYNIIPQVGYEINGTPVQASNISYANNVWIGKALVGRGMNGLAYISVAGATDKAGNSMAVQPQAGAFAIDTVPPEVGQVQIIPQDGGECSRIGEVTFIITFIEQPPEGSPIPDALDYSKSPEVVFYPANSTTSVKVTQYSYQNNTWTGKAVITNNMNNGEATLNITGATDKAGNRMPAYNLASFCIDVLAPVSVATTAYRDQGPIKIDYTAQDLPTEEASGLKRVDLYYRVDIGDDFSQWKWTGLAPQAAPMGTFVFNPINGDGLYEFYTIATDNANNVEAAPYSADVSYNYDSQGPRIKDVRVTPDPAGAGTVTLEIEFRNDENGLDYDVSPRVEFKPYGSSVYYRVNQLTWADNVWVGEANILNSYSSGQAEIKISGARDRSGNEMSSNSAYGFAIDNSPPQVLSVQIIPQDGANCSRVGEVTFIITFSENYLLNYNISPVVSFYPARTVAPVMVTKYSYDNNVWTGKAVVTPNMENGEATVNITGAADVAGNVIPARNTDHFCIDVVPPQSAATAAYKGNSINIDYTAQDLPTEEASGLKKVDLYYRVDMGNGFSAWAWTGLDPQAAPRGTFVFSPKDDGTYEFYTIAIDKANNVEAAPVAADVSIIYDTKGPKVKSVKVTPDPAGEGVVIFEVEFANEINGLNYNISPLVEFSPLAEATSGFGGSSPIIKVKVDQISWEDNIWTGRATILQSYNSGEATIKISNAQDMSGNVMVPDSSWTFTIDTDPPIVSAVTVNPNPAKAGEVLITIDFIEEHSVLDMRVDPKVYVLTHNPNGGVRLIVEKTSYNNNRFTGRAQVPDQVGIDGPADVWVSGARDAVGNEMPATNANTFIIDVTKPSSQAFSKKYTYSNQIAIDFQASDPGVYATGPQYVELYWRYSQDDGNSWTGWAPYGVYTGSPSSYGLTGTITYPALREGVYEFYTLATDRAGNVELPPAAADTRIIYDKSIIAPPEVKIVTVDPNPAKNGYAYITIEFYENEAPLNYNIFPSVTVTPYGGQPLNVGMVSYRENSKIWKGKLLINNHNSGIATINISGAKDIVGNMMRPDSTWTFFIDTLVPNSSVNYVPPYTKSNLIKVDFRSQDPEPSSGLRNTYLWYRYKKEGTDLFSPWICYNPNAINSNNQGTFDFYPDQPYVSAEYEFYTLAEDNAKNLEKKEQVAEKSTIYDVGLPEVLEVSLNSVRIEPYNPSYAARAGKLTVKVKFKEEFSGLNYGKSPQVSFRPYGTTTNLKLTQTAYNNYVWTGEYNILSNIPNGEAVLTISKAEDMSGNIMTDNSSYKFMIDTDYGDVFSEVTSSPQWTNASPFNVNITARDNSPGGGVESVTLYYRLNQGQPSGFGGWIEYTTKNNIYGENIFEPVVDFLPPYQGTYEFYTIAKDKAGNTEGVKYNAESRTVYDSVKPSSVISSIPSSYTIGLSEFKIYFDAFDQVPSSGINDVNLYYRVDANNKFEAWNDAQLQPVMNQARDHGYFIFIPGQAGEYEFYTQAIDNAGNVEEGEEAEAAIIIGLKEVEKEICYFGGKVESGPNGPLILEFPEGALSDCVIIKVKPVAGEAVTDINSIGPVFDLQPSGKMFNRPVTLTFNYKESQLGTDVDEGDLAIFYDDGFDWIPLPSTVDPANNTVSTSLLHFSRYALAVLDYHNRPSSLLSDLILTHNPVKAKRPGLVATEFEFMTTAKTGQATLTIFNALGEEIKKIHKSLSRTNAADPTVIPWDGTDEDGYLVNNGIYIFLLKVDSGKDSKTERGVVGVVK